MSRGRPTFTESSRDIEVTSCCDPSVKWPLRCPSIRVCYFRSMRDDSQDLPTNRSAKRADDEPVRGEGPHGLRIHRLNTRLNTKQITLGGSFQAKLHPYL